MAFGFATAQQILFGSGTVQKAGEQAAQLGRRALLVVGRSDGRAAVLTRPLTQAGVAWTIFNVAGEPDLAQVAKGADQARANGCDLVIGLGGGSALDAAKAIAALATNTDPVETYLEVISQARPLLQRPLPCIAIPTTAGTGSEVTRNAVLHCPRRRVKVSLRSPAMLPALALVDPQLTLGLPPSVTAATGADALTQLLEAFVSTRANPLTDALCRAGLPLAARALLRVFRNGSDLAARGDMSLASLFGGLALANAGLGAVHGIAGPLGGMISAPHGALCARLLPFVMAANVQALTRREPAAAALSRYAEAARLLTGSHRALPRDALAWLRHLMNALEIPFLSHWGLTPQALPELLAKARQASSMQANPIVLTDAELIALITDAMAG